MNNEHSTIEVTRSDYKGLMKAYLDNKEKDIKRFPFKYKNAPKTKYFTLKQAKSALDLYEMVYDISRPEKPVRISINL
jgi:hypothetical protein